MSGRAHNTLRIFDKANIFIDKRMMLSERLTGHGH